MVEALAQGLGMSAEVIKAFDEDFEAIREIHQALKEKTLDSWTDPLHCAKLYAGIAETSLGS